MPPVPTRMLLIAACIASTMTVVGVAQSPTRPSAPETYVRAAVDETGDLVIETTDGRSVRIPRSEEQVGFSRIRIAPDRTAVGARADYSNCCTSYPLPLQLVVYRQARLHRFHGIELPIFKWHFVGNGSRIAFSQQPAHFGCSEHYEMREVATERLLASVDLPQPCGQDPEPKAVRAPKWARDLDAASREP